MDHLSDAEPAPDQMVFVRMNDGGIETARWSGSSKDWTRAPFCKWGEPVAWAPVPLMGPNSIGISGHV